MNLFSLIQSDYNKYKKHGGSFITFVFFTQGFWASFQYRWSHAVYRLKIPVMKQILQLICMIWQKVIEITTDISIPASAKVGSSFYIGHFRGIMINSNTVMGSNCNISQGITIGGSTEPRPEAVLEGIAGLLAHPHDPKDIAEKIKHLFEHPRKGIEMGIAARE